MRHKYLTKALYSSDQARKLDARAISNGRSGFSLMMAAGGYAFDVLREVWPECSNVLVYCGGGNNAGDGYIVAGLTAKMGIPVNIYYLASPDKLIGDAQLAYEFALAQGVNCHRFELADELLHDSNSIIVDALLGIGLRGEVGDNYHVAIAHINSLNLPVLALDIASGLCANTGRVKGVAVRATVTATFVGVKKGLLTGQGPTYTGILYYSDLGIPTQIFDGFTPEARILNIDELKRALPARQLSAHKGMFGHLVLAGGTKGMGGAILMAAEASFSCGVGLVSVLTDASHLTSAMVRLPEAMSIGVDSDDKFHYVSERLNKATAVVLGPGLGCAQWGECLFLNVLKDSTLSVVLDADGLNLLASGSLDNCRRSNWILTPHPGEAARLLDCTIADIEGDRFSAVLELQKRFAGVIVLKGAGTLIATGDQVFLCPYGNPAMATAGMGDILSGIIGGLLAQGLSLAEAACLGVSTHAISADMEVAQHGPVGLRATQLFPFIRSVLN